MVLFAGEKIIQYKKLGDCRYGDEGYGWVKNMDR
jgi:hypothetical protein